MDRKVSHLLLAPFLLAVVSSSNMTTDLATQPSSVSEPPSPTTSSYSSSFSSSSPSSSQSPLCVCAPTHPAPTKCPTCPSVCLSQTTPLAQAPPTLAFLRLEGGDDPCRGVVYLHLGPTHSGPVCVDSDLTGLQLCQGAGCGAQLNHSLSPILEKGFHIQRGGAMSNKTCEVLQIECEGASVSRELAAYKVVTGLLSVVVLVIILVRFGPRIYTTAYKRLFGRRRREWIGPTESVSFRVQNTLCPNSDADKRLSYPGLERLAVSNSREPSSNRNSDYDSYN